MHPPELKARALELVAAGLTDCEISRRIGVPRATIRDSRRPRYMPRGRARLPWARSTSGGSSSRVGNSGYS